MNKGEGWDSRSDGPYWGCLIAAAALALFWMALLIYLGVF